MTDLILILQLTEMTDVPFIYFNYKKRPFPFMYLKPEKGNPFGRSLCLGHYSTPPALRTVLDTVILYCMSCTKRFVPMKRYFDYFKIIFIFLQKKGKSFGSHSYPMVLIQERVIWGISQKDKWPLYNFEVY